MAAAIASGLVVVLLISARYTRGIIERRLRRVVRVRYEVGHGTLGQIVQLLEENARYVGRMRVVDESDTEPQQRTVWIETELGPDSIEGVLVDIRARAGVLDAGIDKVTLEAD
jgi:hypothetical protein